MRVFARSDAPALGLLFLAAAALLVLGPELQMLVALGPVAFIVLAAIVRKYPNIFAGFLPFISIMGDGLLFHIHKEPPIRLSTIVLLILVSSVLTSKKIFHPQTSLIAGWMVILLAVNYFTIAIPTRKQTSLQLFAILIEGLVLCIVVSTIAPKPRIVLWSLALSALGCSYFSFFPEYQAGGRPYALSLDPNFIGAIVAVGLVAVLTLTRIEKSRLPLLVAIPFLPALVQVQSRASAVAAAVGGLVVLASSRDRRTGITALFAVAAFAVAFYMIDSSFGFGAFTDRRVDTKESAQVREELNKLNYANLESEPLLGIGIGVSAESAKESGAFGQATVAHNEYLRFAAEAGLPAIMGLVMLFAGPAIFGTIKGIRQPQAADMAPTVAAVMIFLFFLNSLDSSPLATLAMTVAGASWGWTYKQGGVPLVPSEIPVLPRRRLNVPLRRTTLRTRPNS